MTVPLYNMTLKCAKCGVISSADVSTTATSNAMLVPLIIFPYFSFFAFSSALFSSLFLLLSPSSLRHLSSPRVPDSEAPLKTNTLNIHAAFPLHIVV